MAKLKGHVRRSQLITTYGVGSIIPVAEEAFMVAGLEHWAVGEPDLHEPRLERELRIFGFVQPPATDESPDVPVIRFPTFQSCPICRRLGRHGDFTSWDLSDCSDCSATLVPSRFVIACEKGHIDDFPYERWVHHGAPKSAGRHDLELHSTGTTASLAGIVIRCSCKAERTMEDAFDRFALRDVSRCLGRHPWRQFQGEACDQTPRTLQRGASSVWFAHTRSALSIPPWSESASRALDAHWKTLRHLPIDGLAPILESMKLPEKTGFSTGELLLVAKSRKEQESGEASGERDLRSDEYDALVRGREESTKDTDFATRPGTIPTSLGGLLAQLQLATRLREVRALDGFSRVFPPRGTGTSETNVVTLGDESMTWLPGIEVKGEGLFVRLDSDALAEWEQRPEVIERTGRLAQRDKVRHESWGTKPPRTITPRLLLLHILAHALINQLALDAGYPAGSLRERLYAEGEMAGLLIYTASTDSAGSLGGLISHGEDGEFEPLVRDALSRFAWCSADPVCIESEAAGADSLNLAACHSCALLPETSCEEQNMFLDRALLVGAPGAEAAGYFSALL